MSSWKMTLALTLLVGCGSTGRGTNNFQRLDGGVSDLGACRAEGFACAKASECCGGLACTLGMCSNAAAVDMRAPRPDMSTPMNNGLACGALLTCVNDCASQQCVTDCFDSASPRAGTLFDDTYACLFGDMNGGGACPGANNGVCDTNAPNYVKANCDACLMKAQNPGGRCENQLLACLGDCNTDNDCEGLTCGGAPCTCSNKVCS